LKPRLLVILGPTGTGKSEVAIGVAERLDGEIVGCDALQVYRGLDAATAKPDAEALRRVRHHLIDSLDPRTDSTLADYVEAAEAAIDGILARGKLPLIVGGTGLYLRGLLRGIIAAPARDTALRDRLRRIIERGGALRLHRLLARLDPVSAARVPRADAQRLVRALELAQRGPSWSERLAAGGGWREEAERYPNLKIGLDLPRQAHAARIEARVEGFFQAGLVQEVKGLLASGLPREANAFKAIGYREVLAALDRGEAPESTREEICRKTRRYAKRQRSWFRREPGIVWLDAATPREQLVERIVDAWRGA
jgi:tRNA dimethylallyltransferase